MSTLRLKDDILLEVMVEAGVRFKKRAPGKGALKEIGILK